MRLLLALAAFALSSQAGIAALQRSEADQGGHVEDIYVARSLRLSRLTPTAYCAQERVGFAGSTAEDQYTFHSTATRASDGDDQR